MNNEKSRHIITHIQESKHFFGTKASPDPDNQSERIGAYLIRLISEVDSREKGICIP